MEEARVNGFMLGTFEDGGEEFPGVVFGDDVVDLRTVVPGIGRIGDLFADWDAHLDALEAIDPAAAGARPLDGLRVLPPVQPVGTIIAAGANYREHVLQMSVAHKLGKEGADAAELAADAAAEIDERGRTGDPYVWTGIPSAVCGAYDDVKLPDVGGNVDWELELGVVIGRRAHRVAAEDAFEYVAGYTIVNDANARTAQRHRDDGHRLVPCQEPADVLPHRPLRGAEAVRPGSCEAPHPLEPQRHADAGCLGR